MKKRIALLVAVAMLATIAVGCAQTSAPASSNAAPANNSQATSTVVSTVTETVYKDAERIKMSNAAGVEQPVNYAFDEVFGPYVTEKTNGAYVVEVYPAGQLADDQRAIEMCRAGTIEMSCSAAAWMTPVVADVGVFDIPFLFSEESKADYVIDSGVGELIQDSFADKDLVFLGFAEHGHRHLTNSKHDVATVDDVAGLKIRVMDNPNHLALWSQLGANPIAMARTEVFSALQQKVIDAQENPIPDFFSSAIHEVAPYITLTGHIYSVMDLVYSKKKFDSYSADVQNIIREASQLLLEDVRKRTRETIVDETQEMLDFGCTITTPTQEAHDGFAAKCSALRDQIAGTIDQEFYQAFMEKVAEADAQ